MKKLIMVLMTAATFSTFSCDTRRSSERKDDANDNTELAEPDSADASPAGEMDNGQIKVDTASVWDRDRDNRMDADSVRNIDNK